MSRTTAGTARRAKAALPKRCSRSSRTAEAAGIFVEASADSYGPGCSTLADPPAIYAASFTTGAINGSTTSLASFSSRGP